MPDLDKNRFEIELLKRELTSVTSLLNKFDDVIDKLQYIASDLSKVISLHEQKLNTQEVSIKEIEETLEMRRIEHNNEIKDLHSRITTVNRELTEKIDETETKIINELKNLRGELKLDDDETRNRLTKIEMWKWMMMGGVFILGWFASKILPNIKIF